MEAGNPVRGYPQRNKIHPDELVGGGGAPKVGSCVVESVRRGGLTQLLVCF